MRKDSAGSALAGGGADQVDEQIDGQGVSDTGLEDAADSIDETFEQVDPGAPPDFDASSMPGGWEVESDHVRSFRNEVDNVAARVRALLDRAGELNARRPKLGYNPVGLALSAKFADMAGSSGLFGQLQGVMARLDQFVDGANQTAREYEEAEERAKDAIDDRGGSEIGVPGPGGVGGPPDGEHPGGGNGNGKGPGGPGGDTDETDEDLDEDVDEDVDGGLDDELEDDVDGGSDGEQGEQAGDEPVEDDEAADDTGDTGEAGDSGDTDDALDVEEPGEDSAADDSAAGDEPAGDGPAGDEPGGDEPGGDEPGGDEAAADQPGDPAGDAPGIGQPAGNGSSGGAAGGPTDGIEWPTEEPGSGQATSPPAPAWSIQDALSR